MLVQFGALSCDFRPWKVTDGKVFDGPFALDVETTMIVDHEVPQYVLGAVCAGRRGFFLPLDRVAAFLTAHRGCPIVFHNCAFDLAVLNALLKGQGSFIDVYHLVDNQLVWDTQILHRLYVLATDGHTCQGKGQSTLDACARRYLNTDLPKELTDEQGNDVRTSWSLYQGKPAHIPELYLRYLSADVLCTYGCFEVLRDKVGGVLANCNGGWGFVDKKWLESVCCRYGPLTHHIQVKAAIALNDIERVGFGLDTNNSMDIQRKLQAMHDELREELRIHGYLEGEKGCQKAMQVLIRKAVENVGIDYPCTDTGLFSTKEEDLETLASVSEFFGIYMAFRQVDNFLNNYLRKMTTTRIHPHYDLLKTSGRASSSDPNIQGFPKKPREGRMRDFDLRRCFVPAEGKIFYVADYSTLELRTLAQAILTQFGWESRMADTLNAGVDVHRQVAARMKATKLPDGAAILDDPTQYSELAASLTDSERNGAKPANFGLPVGMGVRMLKWYARVQYGQPYTDEEAQCWSDAWLKTFPEMARYRENDFDSSLALAAELGMTPANYAIATGRWPRSGPDENCPAGWLGGMALKVLRETNPTTRGGRAYTEAELDYFWSHLQKLGDRLKKKSEVRMLQARQPSLKLAAAVRRLIDRAGVFTITGRLRAKAIYTARRNTTFQGAAADGAKLALYRLWRAGFVVVAFIHDEVVVEVDASANLAEIQKQIDTILIDAMREICPDIRIEVEGAFRGRWGKDKADAIRLTDNVVTRNGDRTGIGGTITITGPLVASLPCGSA